MSTAFPVTKTSGIVPGVAVKFMRDGVKSANFLAMPSLETLVCSVCFFFFPLLLVLLLPASSSPSSRASSRATFLC